MSVYPASTLDSYVQAYETAGIDLSVQIKANAVAIQNAGSPSPRPQKAPPDGANSQQIKCSNVAYILYQIELLDPEVDPNQAWSDYCDNHALCFDA